MRENILVIYVANSDCERLTSLWLEEKHGSLKLRGGRKIVAEPIPLPLFLSLLIEFQRLSSFYRVLLASAGKMFQL